MDHLLTTVSSEKGPPPGAGGVGPEAPTARPGATHTSSRFRRGLLAWLRAFPFLAPSLFGVSVFLLLPVVLIFVLSLLQWNLLSPPKFVGFQNFLTIFQQDGAGHSLLVTAYYVVLAIPLQTVLSLGMAVMLNRKLPGMGVYRVLFVVPFMATPVALAVVWNWIFDPKFGFANLVLGYLGIPAQNWLGSYRLAMPVLAAVQIRQWVGYNMLFFLAGLQGIPSRAPRVRRHRRGWPLATVPAGDAAPLKANHALCPRHDDHRLVPGVRHRLRPDRRWTRDLDPGAQPLDLPDRLHGLPHRRSFGHVRSTIYRRTYFHLHSVRLFSPPNRLRVRVKCPTSPVPLGWLCFMVY